MTLRTMMATLAALRVTNNTHYQRQFRRYRQPVPSDKLDVARARVLELSPVAPPEETIETIKAIGNEYRLSKEAVGGLVEDFLDFHDIDPEAPPAVAELRSGYRVLGSGNDGEILDDLVNAIIGETLETLNASPLTGTPSPSANRSRRLSGGSAGRRRRALRPSDTAVESMSPYDAKGGQVRASQADADVESYTADRRERPGRELARAPTAGHPPTLDPCQRGSQGGEPHRNGP